MTRIIHRQRLDWPENLVKIGEIVKPHGIRGEVKAYSYSEQPENFKQYKKVVLQLPDEKGTAIYKVIGSRTQGKLAILQLGGITSREAAENIQGSGVWLEKGDLPQLGGDEFYWHQLLNLQVYTVTGRMLGKVAGFFSTKAHDVLVVTGEGREYLIPVKEEILTEIDVRHGKLLITAPPGLLEANEEG